MLRKPNDHQYRKDYISDILISKKTINIILKYNNIELQRTNKAKYLGVILVDKLSWSKHVEYITKKATNKFKILKRLAGTKWGSSRHTLNTTYNKNVKPTVKYCGEILITANSTNKTKPEHVQNEAMRLISDSVKSTPKNAKHALTHNMPIITELEQQALIQCEKMIRLPNTDVWEKYPKT